MRSVCYLGTHAPVNNAPVSCVDHTHFTFRNILVQRKPAPLLSLWPHQQKLPGYGIGCKPEGPMLSLVKGDCTIRCMPILGP
jgi:hypothetical protein